MRDEADPFNPYSLTTEDQLATRYRERIEPFWATGRRGTLKGESSVSIAYVAFGSGAEEVAVVISSGRTESFVKYKELIYDMSQQGFAVYILDHRGQGFSERVNAHPERKQMGDVINFDDYVTDLRTFYRTIQEHQPRRQHKRYVLVGHSMGGAIASLYLERYPHDFERAVLSSPMHEPSIGMVVE
jgi:lysophospholipase